MLELRNVSKVYDGVIALRDVSLKIDQHEVLGVFGPNGSGKSTLLKIIAGFEKPSCGSVIFEGVDITALPPHKIARLGIVYAFQIPRPFKNLTVVENIAVSFLSKYGRSEAEKRAEELLEEFGLEHIAKLRAANLSQGEMKILEVLRALACEPKLLLLDEPFAALDSENAKKMMNIVLRIKSTCAVIITAHRMKILRKVAERFVEIREGKIHSLM